ncbi:hypothetical protein FKP32DRAFT_333715 [Trametes sanguinea]|nr:hypothetical protein FKP32DRAFT_333715 [Trametes sanguinea]
MWRWMAGTRLQRCVVVVHASMHGVPPAKYRTTPIKRCATPDLDPSHNHRTSLQLVAPCGPPCPIAHCSMDASMFSSLRCLRQQTLCRRCF